jgi:hypothetical protein
MKFKLFQKSQKIMPKLAKKAKIRLFCLAFLTNFGFFWQILAFLANFGFFGIFWIFGKIWDFLEKFEFHVAYI